MHVRVKCGQCGAQATLERQAASGTFGLMCHECETQLEGTVSPVQLARALVSPPPHVLSITAVPKVRH